jgi:hypothetical protein
MTRRQLPSGVACRLDFLIPDNWSAEQAFAVVELIDDLRWRICTHYHSHCTSYSANNVRLP